MKGFFTEKILFAKLKSQDQEAFLEVYDRYVDKVYRFIYFKVSDAAEAEDLTAATFLKTWQHIQQNSVTDAKTLPALVYRIARNVIIDHYRQNSKCDVVSIETPEGQSIVDEKQDISKESEVNSDLELMKKKMEQLKDEYREILVLRYVNDLSIDEIAEIIGKNKGNVRVLIYRATAALKELMQDKNS